MKIRLATRTSPLALAQADMAVEYLRSRIAGAEFEIVGIKTSGDKRQDWSLSAYGGKGLFTKEIEDALLDGSADIAVHSAKDLPTETPEGLEICGCLPRDAFEDVLVLRSCVQVPTLVATGSPRRRAQLKKIFPQVVWTEIRGNVHTRLRKITEGVADATVLSLAGLLRLKIDSFEGVEFKPIKTDICVPAAGQGIIALQCRSADAGFYAPLLDEATKEILSLERKFLESFGGGCHSACAAHTDGSTFKYFHDLCGFGKFEFPQNATIDEKHKLVEECVEKIRQSESI